MLFRVSHVTDYHYTAPVAEAYLELRLKPLNRRDQAVKRHSLTLEPPATPSGYEDYFGNQVSVVSLPFRHSRLVIESEAVVSTTRSPLPEQSLSLSVQESRQILSSTLPFSFDYLQPTEMVKIGRDATQWAKRYLRGNSIVRDGLEELNRSIHETFEYEQGSTQFSTDVGFVWKARKGVCQDFAHIMLSVLRTAGLPARYVCGYIETSPPAGTGNGSPALIGSVATHARWKSWSPDKPGLPWIQPTTVGAASNISLSPSAETLATPLLSVAHLKEPEANPSKSEFEYDV
jgi:transglutaminase-like putative cysteine protease